MKATIIEARDLKVGDRFLTSLGYIDSIVEIRQRDDDLEDWRPSPVIDVWFGDEKSPLLEQCGTDHLVTRIDPDEPEPVEVREKFLVFHKSVGGEPGLVGRYSDPNHARDDAVFMAERYSPIEFEHVRETVLSRETVLPEPPT